MKKFSILSAVLLSICAFSQQGKLRKVAAVGFLNVENLWDTIRSADYIDGTKEVKNPAFHRSIPMDSITFLEAEKYDGPWNDDALIGRKAIRYQSGSGDFTPSSAKNYSSEIYKAKLANEARVISELGAQYTRTAPAVVGLIEVENRQVVEDLIREPALKKHDYGIIHYNSYDHRGIDVALIYQKKRFMPVNSLKKELKIFGDNGRREYTRDILVVSGLLDHERVAFFMNHWPSRRGGEALSQSKRNAAAVLLKQQMDSIRSADPSVKLIAMGDFNDDPVDPSLKDYLEAQRNPLDLSEKKPYLNLMYPLYKKGVASLAYQDAPNLFDQIIVSKNLIADQVTKAYSVYKAEIFAPAYLISREGNYKGYPFRSWDGDRFTGGYSDHFPAFVILQREP